jgi:hypothetical protein
MKIWQQDIKTPTHHLVKLHCEKHSDYLYVGDLNDDEIRLFLSQVQEDIEIEKNLKLLKYYGYLHLFKVTK